jgi:manganese transport protein
MVLATDMAEYMGLIIAVHLLTGVPLDVAAVFALVDVVLLASLSDRRALFARVIGGFVAVVALSFLVELWLVKPPLWEVALGSVVPRLPEGAAVVAVAIMGATIMPHALVLHSHLTHVMDRGVLGASAINASMQIMAATALFGRAVDLGKAPAVLEPLFGGLAAFLFSVALFAASLSASAVSVEAGVLVFRYATGRWFSAAAARLTARLVNIAPALAALHLGASPVEVLVYTQYVLSPDLPVVMAAAVRWSWRMLGSAGRATALAGTVFVTAMDLYTFVAG